MDCITFTADGDEADLRTRLNAPATQPRRRTSTSSRRAEDRPRHGQGRGRLPALRPVRRALPDRRLGHAEVPARDDARRAGLPHAGQQPRTARQGGVERRTTA
ncbi:MAG: hypothetical protein MZW92_36035 [Comamonadaceae bacterium]|nr:hypothetical protein [Comamonadaceae bacterium]